MTHTVKTTEKYYSMAYQTTTSESPLILPTRTPLRLTGNDSGFN